MIFYSFPESYNGLVIAVSNFVFGSNTLKYDDVIGVILSEETHRKTSGGSTSEGALNTQRKGRTTERGNDFKNHGKSKRKSKGKRSQLRRLNNCWYYGKPGHMKKESE